MSAPIEKMDEKHLRRFAENQRRELAKMKGKNERQRAYINRLIAANDDCVFRIEAELLREELAERNAAPSMADEEDLGRPNTGHPGYLRT